MRQNHNFFGQEIAPAIGIAKGHGPSYPAEISPELRSFLMLESATAPWEAVPQDAAYVAADGKFVLDRIYLLYCLGWFWKIVGFSWTATIGLGAFFLSLCGLCVYGIFRQFMSNRIAVPLALTAGLLPQTLVMLPSLRDLGKGPFILATILYCCYVAAHARSARAYFLSALGVGLVIGVGFGFRQDSLICLPAAACFCLCAARLEGAGLQPVRRILATGLLVVAFLVPAAPPLLMTADSGGNNAFYLAQGYSAHSLDNLEIENRAYTPLYSHLDYVVHAYLYCSALDSGISVAEDNNLLWRALAIRTALQAQTGALPAEAVLLYPPFSAPLTIWSRDAELYARAYVLRLATMFPGDALTRWYAATVVSLRGLEPGYYAVPAEELLQGWQGLLSPLFGHFRVFGVFYAIAGFVLLSQRNVWLAVALVGLLVYFTGYPSLSFQWRHTYHLAFACLLFPGICLDRVLGPGGLIDLFRKRGAAEDSVMGRSIALKRRRIMVVSIGLIAVVAALGVPWTLAGLVQRMNLDGVHAQYSNADIDSAAVEMETLPDGGTLVRPQGLPDLGRSEAVPAVIDKFFSPMPVPDFVCEYMALDLTSSSGSFQVDSEYNDGSYNGRHRYTHPSGGTRVRLFVPVFRATSRFDPPYEKTPPEFQVFRVPSGISVDGVYRVRDRSLLPGLMTLWLTDKPGDLQGWALQLGFSGSR
jgi:hypothetical protein